MSVIVKGVKMPTTCTMCWLNTFCGVWNEEPVKHKGFNERLEDCPLTELIQCKDCKHSKEIDSEWLECQHDKRCMKENGFCSWAERRGEE